MGGRVGRISMRYGDLLEDLEEGLKEIRGEGKEEGEKRKRSLSLYHDDLDLEANLSPLHPEVPPSLLPTGISSATSSTPLINIVYHTTVPLREKGYFEMDWLVKMTSLYESLQGFRYRSVNLLIQTKDVCEYLVIIACSDYPAFLRWERSPQRTKMMSLLKSHRIVTRRLYTTSEDPSTPEDGHNLPSRAYLKDPLGPTPASLPPPKWKLCIVIYLGVIMNIFLWSYSGVPLVMAEAGMPLGFNLFVSLAISVPILAYAFFPLVMSIPLVSRWLRAPRPEKMSAILKILDQGLPMFAPKLTPGPSKEVVAHFKKMECRLEATRRIQHQLSGDIERLRTQLNLTRGNLSPSLVAGSPQDPVRNKVTEGIQRSIAAASGSVKRSKSTPSLTGLSLGSESLHQLDVSKNEEIKEGDHGPITVAVAHWVKWEHILDFELWTEEITSAMATFEGFLGLTTIIPKSEAEPYINCFTYDTPGHMMKFIDSEVRQSFLMKLRPFLESDSQAQTIVNRVIEDAFTELFVATGDQAEMHPPPIWKSTILTLIPLHIIVWQLGGNLLKILEGNAHLEFNIAIVISTVLTVVFNSYVGVPLMHSQFGEWLRQERVVANEKGCSRILDTGLRVSGRIAVLLVWWSFALVTGSLGVIHPASSSSSSS